MVGYIGEPDNHEPMCSKGDRRLITSKQCELGENFGAKPSNFQAENDWLQSLLTGQEAPEAGKKILGGTKNSWC